MTHTTKPAFSNAADIPPATFTGNDHTEFGTMQFPAGPSLDEQSTSDSVGPGNTIDPDLIQGSIPRRQASRRQVRSQYEHTPRIAQSSTKNLLEQGSTPSDESDANDSAFEPSPPRRHRKSCDSDAGTYTGRVQRQPLKNEQQKPRAPAHKGTRSATAAEAQKRPLIPRGGQQPADLISPVNINPRIRWRDDGGMEWRDDSLQWSKLPHCILTARIRQ